MRELALHILDVLQNAVEAGAKHVDLTVDEDPVADRLTITVTDDGPGIASDVIDHVTDPFFTSRTTRRVGLGLPLLAAATERTGGSLTICSMPSGGTKVIALFGYHHPDRQPLGDVASTVLAFLMSDRSPDLRYMHRMSRLCDDKSVVSEFRFDSADIRSELSGVPFNFPAVSSWLAEYLAEGEQRVADEGLQAKSS